MKFTIDKGLLLENIINVAKALPNKNIIPILNGIKFELTKEELALTASNSELTIKTTIPKKLIKKIDTEGVIVIGSKYIIDIIRKMPTDIINFEIVDGLKIKIYSDNSEYNLNCLDTKEYPNPKLEFHKSPLTMKTGVLKELINQTSLAVSTQELRPILTGINIKINGNILNGIATDSYRLAKKTIELSEPAKEELDIVIPGKYLIELEKILVDEDELIEIHLFNNKVLFKYKELLFQSNLLNGNYPNTNNLIPTEFELVIKSDLKTFYDAVDRAALLTQSRDKNIVKLKLEKGIMTIESFSSDIGRVEEKINVEVNSKNEIDISFSSKYMLEALRSIKEEEILILLNTSVKPIVLKSVKDESLIQLILPIMTY